MSGKAVRVAAKIAGFDLFEDGVLVLAVQLLLRGACIHVDTWICTSFINAYKEHRKRRRGLAKQKLDQL